MEAQQHRDYTEEGVEGAMEVRPIRLGILKKWSFGGWRDILHGMDHLSRCFPALLIRYSLIFGVSSLILIEL